MTVETVYPTLTAAEKFTAEKLLSVRSELDEALKKSPHKEKITVITAGSYGRGEASEESDMDIFILFDSDSDARDTISSELATIARIIDNHVPNSVGDTGTFGPDAHIKFSDLTSHIGGDHETNKSLTRRLLFLLESVHLYGEQRFNDYRKKLLEKYILETSPADHISRFLLNDIIRYYRTIAIDFEHKVSEQSKDWGLRNVKLRFSRKLIYFGGLIVVAELVGMGREEKIQNANKLFSMSALERLRALSGQSQEEEAILSRYNSFLEKISDSVVRQSLSSLTRANRDQSQEFTELRAAGIEFSKALEAWLRKRYDPEHPIHHSLVF